MARKFRNFGDIEEHYEVLEQIGGGAQGDLHLGRSRSTHERVAVKLQRKREFESEQRFAELAQEITREGAYNHLLSPGPSGTLRLFGIGDYRARRGIVLEFVDGVLLYDMMTKSRPVREPATVASLIGQLCEILDDVHRKGFVHRDVKPENVMVEHSGRVRLIDLGLAIRSRQGTRYGCGTIEYAPPEQLDATTAGVTAQADIFSLGCLLLELTVMCLPYEGTRAGKTARRPIVMTADRLALVPDPFKALALAMVELAPENRPGSVREVFDSLRCYLPVVNGPRPVKPLEPDPTEYYRTHPPKW